MYAHNCELQGLKQSVEFNSHKLWNSIELIMHRLDEIEEQHLASKCADKGKPEEIGIVIRNPDGYINIRLNDIKDQNELLKKGFVTSHVVS